MRNLCLLKIQKHTQTGLYVGIVPAIAHIFVKPDQSPAPCIENNANASSNLTAVKGEHMQD